MKCNHEHLQDIGGSMADTKYWCKDCGTVKIVQANTGSIKYLYSKTYEIQRKEDDIKFELIKDKKVVGTVEFYKDWGGVPTYGFYIPVTELEKKHNARTHCTSRLDDEQISFVMSCELKQITF